MAKPQVLLQEHLKALRLPTFLREYSKLARQCASEGVDYPRYLLRLSELELLDRESRATERRIKAAKFPVTKSLDSFDFLALPSLNKNLAHIFNLMYDLPTFQRPSASLLIGGGAGAL